MDSFASDYLRQMSADMRLGNTGQNDNDFLPSSSRTWNSHYSITDISLNKIDIEEGNATLCESTTCEPVCRELKFCELPSEIRCMYEIAKCGMNIADSFGEDQFQDSMMQYSGFVDPASIAYRRIGDDHKRPFDINETPTWDEFKSDVEEASSGRWDIIDQQGEKRFQELMEESFEYVEVVKSPSQSKAIDEANSEEISGSTTTVRDKNQTVQWEVPTKTVGTEPKDRDTLELIMSMLLGFLIFVVLPMWSLFHFGKDKMFDFGKDKMLEADLDYCDMGL